MKVRCPPRAQFPSRSWVPGLCETGIALCISTIDLSMPRSAVPRLVFPMSGRKNNARTVPASFPVRLSNNLIRSRTWHQPIKNDELSCRCHCRIFVITSIRLLLELLAIMDVNSSARRQSKSPSARDPIGERISIADRSHLGAAMVDPIPVTLARRSPHADKVRRILANRSSTCTRPLLPPR
jgi:hypothetical protein